MHLSVFDKRHVRIHGPFQNKRQGQKSTVMAEYIKLKSWISRSVNSPDSCMCVWQKLTSSRAVMLQLVAVHCLFAVRSFPEGGMNIERRETPG